jgi:hypothetical protein
VSQSASSLSFDLYTIASILGIDIIGSVVGQHHELISERITKL